MFRELERKNKQISQEECINILKTEKRGVLSVNGCGGYPYGMPMNYWYNEEDGKLYFHCGEAGHRTDALKENNKVSFCVYDQGVSKEGAWALTVKSVIIFGRTKFVTDREKVVEIMTKLSHKFTQDEEFIKREIANYLDETLLLELTPEHICGKCVVEA